MGRRILPTGGAGHIGSHIYLELIEAEFSPVTLDSFANAQDDLPDRLGQVTGQPVSVIRGDATLLVEKLADVQAQIERG
jgi:UDP-glucose 4-epimerase